MGEPIDFPPGLHFVSSATRLAPVIYVFTVVSAMALSLSAAPRRAPDSGITIPYYWPTRAREREGKRRTDERYRHRKKSPRGLLRFALDGGAARIYRAV